MHELHTILSRIACVSPKADIVQWTPRTKYETHRKEERQQHDKPIEYEYQRPLNRD